MNYTGLLPIGSIVTLKDMETQDVMIIGYCPRKAEENGKIFDYCGCLHPIGLLAPDSALLFNHDQIQRIRVIGYLSDASYAVLPRMEEILTDLRKKASGDDSV